MKTIRHFVIIAAVMAAAISCSKNDDSPKYEYYRATVTFRPQEDGTYFVKQSDQTALLLMNEDMKEYPFKNGQEKRAYIEYGYDKDSQSGRIVEGFENTWDVYLVAMDTLYTKKPVQYDPENDKYGNDPIGIYTTNEVFPTTYIEDGYLNIRFMMSTGYTGVIHEINLLTGVNPDDPYYVELRHNSFEDEIVFSTDGIINFPLKSLPDTEGKTVKLTLGWNSIVSGKLETATFDYCSRTDW